jgi:hypothetical protein
MPTPVPPVLTPPIGPESAAPEQLSISQIKQQIQILQEKLLELLQQLLSLLQKQLQDIRKRD